MLLVLAALATPTYLLLDAAGVLPLSMRDRPWPFLLLALLLPALALRKRPRWRVAALSVAIVSSCALGWASQARYRLPDSSELTQLPEISLPDQDGQATSLRGDRPLLLVWFRGSWCPYCKKQLSEIAGEAKRYQGDIRILAVAPDPPEPLAKMKRELSLPFTLLSDPQRQLVNRCELSHCVAIVDARGEVKWQVISGNWERNLPARALLQAAYRAR
jgi:peroxiredoxin